MYFFHKRLVEHALETFKRQQFASPKEANTFFGLFAPGNTSHFAERPFERFSDYEELLWLLREADQEKYESMHKGTPFYFMSWLAFDLRNYEKALFYIDAGISEDIRNDPMRWKGNPGARFLLLDPQDQAAKRTVDAVRQLLKDELDRFNKVSNQPPLDIDNSFRQFVHKLLEDHAQRTIVSAIYVFILEFGNHMRELTLRQGSPVGGSNQPFTVHLFTGGLLFESLLKCCYQHDEQKKTNNTLGDVFRTRQFLQDFSLSANLETSAEILNEIHTAIQGSDSVETAFSTSAKLRNTTGHNLVWDNIFETPEKYKDLFWQVMNALLFVISKKFA